MTIYHYIVTKDSTNADKLEAIYNVAEMAFEGDSMAWTFIRKVSRGSSREIVIDEDGETFEELKDALEMHTTWGNEPTVQKMVFGVEVQP